MLTLLAQATTATASASPLVHMGVLDYLVIIVYFVFVLGIGFYLQQFAKTGEEFFMAGREMTAWVAGLAFLSANLGALELMGWAGSAYQHGIMAAHWYWVGAIPAMIFLGLVMMPFYYICKTHSVPGYLALRYGPAAGRLSAISFAFMTVLMSGVNMFLTAKVLNIILGWEFNTSLILSSLCVAVYVSTGGLLSAVFNEVLQFVLIWFGALLIPILGLMETGGWSGMVQRIQDNLIKTHPDIVNEPNREAVTQNFTHAWAGLGSPANNHMHIEFIGIVFGLGAVLSMGYWTTDFLVVQRVLTAKDMRAAKMAPIIGAGFKLFVPIIVILPGLLGLAVLDQPLVGEDQASANPGLHTYNDVLPLMLARYCGPGLLGLGVTALIAGFMSGMAGNVSAFTTVWTYDIYRDMLNPNAKDEHYVSMGRWSTIVGVVISIGTAYLCKFAPSVMDYVQALFSFFIAPLFGTVLLGMLWKRATAYAGFWGLLAGTLGSISLFLCIKFDPTKDHEAIQYIAFSKYASGIAADMYQALWSFVIVVVVTVVVSLLTKPKTDAELKGLVMGCTEIPQENYTLFERPAFWAAIVGIATIIINIIFF